VAGTYGLQEVARPWQQVKADNGMFQRGGSCVYRPELTPWTRMLLEEANSPIHTQKFPYFYATQKVRYSVHKIQPPVAFLSQSNPI
jgi:hypothetical protein